MTASERQAWVICLCAEWCGVCRDWRTAFEREAQAQPNWRFAWIDVEDEAEAMGDVDIETFPTLLIARGGKPLFLGPVLPSAAALARLLATLETQPSATPGLPPEADALLQRLGAGVLDRLAS